MVSDVSKLRREVGLLQLVMYGIGNIVGAGIYVLIGAAAGYAGNAVWLAFVVGSVAALFTGLSYAELASMYPKAASEYVFIGKAFGHRALSFAAEWTMLMTEIVSASTVALGFAMYFRSVIELPTWLTAAFLLTALTTLSLTGIKQSLRLNIVASTVALSGLAVVIAAGIPKLGSVNYFLSPTGGQGILAASILVFFAYIGFDNITNLSEETKNPERTVPRALLISVVLSTILYVLVGLVAVSLTSFRELSASEAPLAYVSSLVLGSTGYRVLTVAALFTTLNTTLVLLLVGSRIIYGMSQEGAMPPLLSRVSSKRGTPVVASLMVLVLSLAFLGLGGIDKIAEITSFGSLFTFSLVNLSLLHLRRVAPHLQRPFRVPGNAYWLPIPALLGAFSCIFLLTRFDGLTITLGLSLPLSGLGVYLVFGRGHHGVEAEAFHEPHESAHGV